MKQAQRKQPVVSVDNAPGQRRRARARNGVALQSAGSFIAGTVKAARPERSQQALPLTLTSDIRH
ncbi:hypothetical protein ACQSAL_27235 [Klebsiella pneumoniae]